MKKGIFISLEGIEGTGKSTQSKLLSESLSAAGYEVLLTFEPGGTRIGQRIREILLQPDHKEMSPVAELMLYNAERNQHLHEVIFPALERGAVVITDRYTDSTVAYQGYGRGIDIKLLKSIDAISTKGFMPDLTILFDLDVKTGLARNRGVNKVDRFELEDVAFHEKVRSGYLELARLEPERIKIIDASADARNIHKKVEDIVMEMLCR
ncbi:MAG: dTMP kinase [Dissulfurispiraceae bacterium]|nr:dTMP kinase [Dissulfurispiraceae bacterium]